MMTRERNTLDNIPIGGPPTVPPPVERGECPCCGFPRAVLLVPGHYDCPFCGNVDAEEMAQIGDIRKAYLEDKHRGERGKSGDKGPKKEKPGFDRDSHRPEQEAVVLGHLREKPTVVIHETRDVQFGLYLTKVQKGYVLQESTRRGWSIARLIGHAFSEWIQAGQPLPKDACYTPMGEKGERFQMLLTPTENRLLQSLYEASNMRRGHILLAALNYWFRENTTRQGSFVECEW